MILFCLTRFLSEDITTPPAVSANIPSVSARSWIHSLISTSGAAIAVPAESFKVFRANGPEAGFPIASDFAIVLGFIGVLIGF